MAYLTENQLDNLIDLPVSLAATTLNMGDWLVIGSVQIQQPMRLTCRWLSLQLRSASVAVASIDSTNLIYGNLGLVYVVLRQNYSGGSPGVSGGLDTVIGTGLGGFARDPAIPIVLTAPGTYSWLIANNTQPSTSASAIIGAGTSIDFEVSVNGSVRLELNAQ